MKSSRRTFLGLAAGAAVLPTVSQIAHAQSYPNRPVRLVVGFAPGGGNDITARLMGQWLSERVYKERKVARAGGDDSNALAGIARSAERG